MQFFPFGTRWEFTDFDGIPPHLRKGLVQTNDWEGKANGARANRRRYTMGFDQEPPDLDVQQPGTKLSHNQRNCGNGIRTLGFEIPIEEGNKVVTVVRGMASEFDSPTSINLPKPVIGTSKSQATIIEMLKVWFYSAHNSTQNSALNIYLSTRSVEQDFSGHIDPATIASVCKLVHRDGSGSVAIMDQNWPVEIDLTDDAGHGVLVATDKMYLSVVSEGTGDTNDVTCRILYRYKTVGITEYVGIVQSQQ